jgi:hypothetical protein
MALALTEGFQAGFVACAVLSGIGLVVSLLFLAPHRDVEAKRLEVQPATGD